jgi:hypothetical protein
MHPALWCRSGFSLRKLRSQAELVLSGAIAANINSHSAKRRTTRVNQRRRKPEFQHSDSRSGASTTCLFAGGGVKPGQVIGATDKYASDVVGG